MTKTQINKTRTIIKQIKGIYGKRIASTKQPFPTTLEYGSIIDSADTKKLAKMIRI